MEMPSNNSTILTTTELPQGAGYHKIVDDYTVLVMQWIFYVVLCGSVSFIGMGTNIINMLVYIRIGLLSDSNTISLFILAVTDFACLLTLFWLSICFIIALKPPSGMIFNPWSVLFFTAGRPHVIVTQVMCAVTAYIAFERCISVIFPFKVKTMFTAKRTLVALASLIVVVSGLYMPNTVGAYLRWVFNPRTNSSQLVFVDEVDLGDKAKEVFNYLNAIALRFFLILSVMVLNGIISWRVTASTKWRQTVVSGDQNQKDKSKDEKYKKAFEKERKLVKMITTICTIFSICYAPDIVLSTLTMIDMDIYNMHQQHNLFHALYCIAFLFEATNSTVNIVVYYRMSTRYRETFRQLFGLKSIK